MQPSPSKQVKAGQCLSMLLKHCKGDSYYHAGGKAVITAGAGNGVICVGPSKINTTDQITFGIWNRINRSVNSCLVTYGIIRDLWSKADGMSEHGELAVQIY